MYSVIVECGDDARSLWFDGAEITIGRSGGNQLILASPEVSKRHARLVRKAGRYIIVDLKSTNGTWVNGLRMRAPLVVRPDADEIGICEYRLRISETTSPGSARVELPGRHIVYGREADAVDEAARAAAADDPTEMCDWRTAPADDAPGDQERDLLAAIAAAPDDDGPRLVYADWLMERGEPRGELIALQCDGGDRGADRVSELLARHGARWLSPFGDGRTCAFDIAGHSARALLPRVGGGDRALPIVLSRGFLAHPLCVSESRMSRLRGELFRLSPTVYVPIAVRAIEGGFRVVDAQVHAARPRDGEDVVLRAPESSLWLEVMDARTASGSLRRARRAPSAPGPPVAAGVGADDAGTDTARIGGLAYWGVSGDAAFVEF